MFDFYWCHSDFDNELFMRWLLVDSPVANARIFCGMANNSRNSRYLACRGRHIDMVRLVYIAFFYSSRKYTHSLYLRRFLHYGCRIYILDPTRKFSLHILSFPALQTRQGSDVNAAAGSLVVSKPPVISAISPISNSSAWKRRRWKFCCSSSSIIFSPQGRQCLAVDPTDAIMT